MIIKRLLLKVERATETICSPGAKEIVKKKILFYINFYIVYALFFRRINPKALPIPNNAIVAGSGTATIKSCTPS